MAEILNNASIGHAVIWHHKSCKAEIHHCNVVVLIKISNQSHMGGEAKGFEVNVEIISGSDMRRRLSVEVELSSILLSMMEVVYIVSYSSPANMPHERCREVLVDRSRRISL